MPVSYTVGDYLVRSLYGRGVRHVFGVPGDYILSFYERLTKSKISVVNMCDEQGAGFAADAYARISGLGVVCITYGVGALKVINTTAQAYAEKSPVVVISGAPGIGEQVKNPLLHHKVRDFDTQKKIFEQITVASTILDDPETAANEINRVLSQTLYFKRPVYVELPRDIVHAVMTGSHKDPMDDILARPESDPKVVEEAIKDSIALMRLSAKPVILAGEEIHRFALQDKLLALIEKTKIPVVTTILSKSVISEIHPLFSGIYGGDIGQERALELVQSSDCLIILGASLSDVTVGMFSAQLDQKKTIFASAEKLSIGYHRYDGVTIRDFLTTLVGSVSELESAQYDKSFGKDHARENVTPIASPLTTPGKRITVKYLFEFINSNLRNDLLILADVGDALYAGTELVIKGNTKFLSPAYYASLGFAVPGSIGAQLADRNLRPLVLVGDGAFQMTGIELSTAIRYNLNPIVIVLNNGVYLTEELMLSGEFNNLQSWVYAKIPEVLGGGYGFAIETEDQLSNAFFKALNSKKAFSILDVHLDRNDRSPALNKLTERMSKFLNSEKR